MGARRCHRVLPAHPLSQPFPRLFPLFFLLFYYFLGGGLRPRPLHATFVFINFSPFNLFTPRSSPRGPVVASCSSPRPTRPDLRTGNFTARPGGGLVSGVFCTVFIATAGRAPETHRLFFFFYIYVIRLEINYFYADIWVVVPRLQPAWDESARGGGVVTAPNPFMGTLGCCRTPPSFRGGHGKAGGGAQGDKKGQCGAAALAMGKPGLGLGTKPGHHRSPRSAA